MFPQSSNLQFNIMAQAAAATVFEGGKLQKERDSKPEKSSQMRFIVRKDEKHQDNLKTNDPGRLA